MFSYTEVIVLLGKGNGESICVNTFFNKGREQG